MYELAGKIEMLTAEAKGSYGGTADESPAACMNMRAGKGKISSCKGHSFSRWLDVTYFCLSMVGMKSKAGRCPTRRSKPYRACSSAYSIPPRPATLAPEMS